MLIHAINVLRVFYFIACRPKEDQEKNFVPSIGEENRNPIIKHFTIVCVHTCVGRALDVLELPLQIKLALNFEIYLTLSAQIKDVHDHPCLLSF